MVPLNLTFCVVLGPVDEPHGAAKEGGISFRSWMTPKYSKYGGKSIINYTDDHRELTLQLKNFAPEHLECWSILPRDTCGGMYLSVSSVKATHNSKAAQFL